MKRLSIALLLLLPLFLGAQSRYMYYQNFDSLTLSGQDLGDWTQASNDDFNWTVYTLTTPSSGGGGVNQFTGPNGDHTTGVQGGGYYLYTEASTHFGQTASVLSPQFTIPTGTSANFSFWYCMHGNNMGTLHVDVLDITTGTWHQDVLSYNGEQGKLWLNGQYTVSDLGFTGPMQVRFRGVMGSADLSDIAIDDFSFWTGTQMSMTPREGQAHPGSTVQFTVSGGFAPYTFSLGDTWGTLVQTGATTATVTLPSGSAHNFQNLFVTATDSNGGACNAFVHVIPNGYISQDNFATNFLQNKTWVQSPDGVGFNNWEWYEQGNGTWWLGEDNDDYAARFSWWYEYADYDHQLTKYDPIDCSNCDQVYVVMDAMSDFVTGGTFSDSFQLRASTDGGSTWQVIWENSTPYERQRIAVNATTQLAHQSNVLLQLRMAGEDTYYPLNYMMYELALTDDVPNGFVEGTVALNGLDQGHWDGVNVAVDNVLTSTTDANGHYLVTKIVGSYQLEYAYPGYAPEIHNVNLGVGVTDTINVTLGPLGPLDLTADGSYQGYVPLHWRAPDYPMDNLHAYDDGSFEGFIGVGTDNIDNGIVTKYAVGSDYDLTHVLFYCATQIPFDLVVYDHDASTGMPGNMLYRGHVELTPTTQNQWVCVQLDDPITVSDTVYVGFLQTHSYGNWVGRDHDSYCYDTNYLYLNGSWSNLATLGYSGNLGIRIASQADTTNLPAYSLNLVHTHCGELGAHPSGQAQVQTREDRSTTVTDYNVYYREQDASDWICYDQHATSPGFYIVTGLTMNQSYEFKVTANLHHSTDGSTVESGPSNIATAAPGQRGSITGIVHLLGRTDYSGVLVKCYAASDLSTVVATATTDASGTYTLSSLPETQYSLEFHCPTYSYENTVSIWVTQAWFPVEAPEVDMTPQGPHDVDCYSYQNGSMDVDWTMDWIEPGELCFDDGDFEYFIKPTSDVILASKTTFANAGTMNAVKYKIADPNHTSGNIRVHIYEADTDGNPGTEIYTGEWHNTDDMPYMYWYKETLANPITVTAGEVLFLGFEANGEWLGIDYDTYDANNVTAWAFMDYNYDNTLEWNWFQYANVLDYFGTPFSIYGNWGVRPVMAETDRLYPSPKARVYDNVTENARRNSRMAAPVMPEQPLMNSTNTCLARNDIEKAPQTRDSNIDHYNIYYRVYDSSDTWQMYATSDNTPSATVPGLTNDTYYECYVTAVIRDENGNLQETTSSVDLDDYTAYGVPCAMNSDADYLILNWDANSSWVDTIVPLVQAKLTTGETFDAIPAAPKFHTDLMPLTYKAVFMSSGMDSASNYMRDGTSTATFLQDYLDHGNQLNPARLYLESGTAFSDGAFYTVPAYMGVDATQSAGSSHTCARVHGVALNWSDTYNYSTSTDFAGVDELVTQPGATIVLKNPVYNYTVGIANPTTNYLTLATSFELAGLTSTDDQQTYFNDIWDYFFEPLNPVTDLSAAQDPDQSNVVLSWSAPESRAVTREQARTESARTLQGYSLYRLNSGDEGNSDTWLSLGEVTDATYIDNDWAHLTSGTYVYAVVALYTTGDSDPVFSNPVSRWAPINTLQCTVQGANVNLTWHSPGSATAVVRGQRAVAAVVPRSLTGYQISRAGTVIAENVTTTNYTDNNVPTGTYEYSVTAVYSDGASMPVTVSATGTGSGTVQYNTALMGNSPNPFNPITTVRFSLAQSGSVDIIIYNLRGEKVKTLVSGNLNAGLHSQVWDGRNDAGQQVAGGVYFYRLTTTNFTQTQKMLLLK